jgi:hypothetical protein
MSINRNEAVPIYRICADGRPVEFGTLTIVDRGGTLLSPSHPIEWLRDDFACGVFPGVPWFLEDSRPQGFLGRYLARRQANELGLPSDIALWNDDAVLTSLVHGGEGASGNFLLGECSLERALHAGPGPVPAALRDQCYSGLAAQALAGQSAGSWAGGEQPKFTTAVVEANGETRHVIVKFSEPIDSHAGARRWADLLICEHIAGELMAERGDGGSITELVWSRGRLCLEVTRFDRIGARGRRGCVTLAAWSDAHDGERDDWASATLRMHRGGWTGKETHEQVRLRLWFGRLIANTDMHFGNLSFFLDNGLPLQLTPSYDMLPMLYRPAGSGEVVARDFQVTAPTAVDLPFWSVAALWAEIFWQRVAGHGGVSNDFRRIAEANFGKVSRARSRFSGCGVY